jgi:hypothetical protein
MGKRILIIVLVVLFPSLLSAQTKEEETWNKVSWITVGINITFDTVHSFKADDRKEAFTKQAIRTGIVFGSAELLKRIIHETRPDGSDNKSFPSEHSEFSCESIKTDNGKKTFIEIPFAFITMLGRVNARKHYWHDTLAGCGIGLAIGLIR